MTVALDQRVGYVQPMRAVMLEVPLLPDDVAVIVANPAVTPVTTPLELTVATEASLVDHVMVWPVITLPCWSFTVATRVTVAPLATDVDAGDTVTDVTTGFGGGANTVISDRPVLPPLVAVIFAAPVATAVTMPMPC